MLTAECADKKTGEPSAFVDIKSTGLRDILRSVLQGVPWSNLKADKPSVTTMTIVGIPGD
jgi:hypothetical protein